MALPTCSDNVGIPSGVQVQNHFRPVSPIHSDRFCIKHRCIGCEVFSIICARTTRRRFILKHEELFLFSIQVYLTYISYGKNSHKRVQAVECRADKHLPEICAF